RPQLVREQWKSLNGLWDYAILPKTQEKPEAFDGSILAPYPIESALSGVMKSVSPEQKLWYRTTFTLPEAWKSKNILLHLEAVDWETDVWLNGQLLGQHRGGYDPFSFDLTPYLRAGDNELLLSVWDPTDTGWQPVGKQVLEPGGIFYTAVTGIWQSVWLEPVPDTHIRSLKLTPDVPGSHLQVETELLNPQPGDAIYVKAFFRDELVSEGTALAGEMLELPVPDAQLWAPGHPNLYDLEIEVLREEEVVDRVQSYFGMRQVALWKDEQGFTRILLNGEALFQNGPLDQGFWPEGIYTPPTEEAMKYDLEVIQKAGFNMLRKHVKVEPRRFYYWCDRMGLLVWQDMPNGDKKIGPGEPDIERTEESARQFEYELKQLVENHYNHPSIIMWVPFNEGWGQYETGRIVDYVKGLDPTRLVNNASGWADRGLGDVHDIHNYPEPRSPEPEAGRAIVLGEFGGLGLAVEGHRWQEENWGYQSLQSKDELAQKYEAFYTDVWRFNEENGLSASIYTQITDVETEANGLMTYDRAVLKIDSVSLRKINTNNFLPAPRIQPAGGLFNPGDLAMLTSIRKGAIRYTTDGSEPTDKSDVYTAPIQLSEDVVLKACLFAGEEQSRVVSAAFTRTDTPRPKYAIPYSPKYSAGGDFGLVDGLVGSTRFSDGRWQGFQGNSLDVVLQLKEPQLLESVKANFLESTADWIFFPAEVVVLYSLDGKNYIELGRQALDIPGADRPASSRTVEIKGAAVKARYIQLKATNSGTCPTWHIGAGQPSWIFVDEVRVQ
nr:chitobiase/beta-hexosaminidase C-terminal domain-containing protein [Saprospiraceae bacterium]